MSKTFFNKTFPEEPEAETVVSILRPFTKIELKQIFYFIGRSPSHLKLTRRYLQFNARGEHEGSQPFELCVSPDADARNWTIGLFRSCVRIKRPAS